VPVLGLVTALVWLKDPPTEESKLLCSRLGANRLRRELARPRRRWVLRLFAALQTATTLWLCGLTFELTPTVEAGAVSLVRDDA
jgi:hypothetical protein